MKVLIVGSDHEAAMEQYFTKYLTAAGVPNALFPAHGLFYKYYNASILNKILFRLGLSSIYKKINRQLLQAVEAEKPSVLLFFKGMETFPETLKLLRSKGIQLTNYNPDNPFLFSGPGSGNKNVTDSIPLFDLHFTYDHEVLQKFKDLKLNAGYIPFGYDISDELLAACEKEPEVLKLCFLGNPDKARADFLNQLAAANLAIDVYGGTWERFKLHDNIKLCGPVYGNEFWKVLRKYRVQLNFMRPHNPHSHNMRSFEVAGIGGIGLFPRTPDHEKFFTENEEVFLYNDIADCIAKAKHILSLPAAQAAEVRRKMRARAVTSGYSYKDRVLQLIQLIKNISPPAVQPAHQHIS
jgi:spore maturation protein CgeB